jgi:hypothetical protein
MNTLRGEHSLIHQLQAEAHDPQARISDILRKAMVAASKLGVSNIEFWLEHELKGYHCCAVNEIPACRTLRGQLQAFNPLQG